MQNGQRNDNRMENLRLLSHIENTRVGKGKEKKVKIEMPDGEVIIIKSIKKAALLLKRTEWTLIQAMRRENNQLYDGPRRIPTGIIYREERATFEEQLPALRKGKLINHKSELRRVEGLLDRFL